MRGSMADHRAVTSQLAACRFFFPFFISCLFFSLRLQPILSSFAFLVSVWRTRYDHVGVITEVFLWSFLWGGLPKEGKGPAGRFHPVEQVSKRAKRTTTRRRRMGTRRRHGLSTRLRVAPPSRNKRRRNKKGLKPHYQRVGIFLGDAKLVRVRK